jgi:hypothetical protein
MLMVAPHDNDSVEKAARGSARMIARMKSENQDRKTTHKSLMIHDI